MKVFFLNENIMKDQLVTFDTAKLAKELGFDEPCIDTYKDVELYKHKAKRYNSSFNTEWREELIKNSAMSNAKIARYSAPTQSLLQKWLREKHFIEVYVVPYSVSGGHAMRGGKGFYEVVVDKSVTTWSGHKSYEEALEKGLQEGLKLIKI